MHVSCPFITTSQEDAKQEIEVLKMQNRSKNDEIYSVVEPVNETMCFFIKLIISYSDYCTLLFLH